MLTVVLASCQVVLRSYKPGRSYTVEIGEVVEQSGQPQEYRANKFLYNSIFALVTVALVAGRRK